MMILNPWEDVMQANIIFFSFFEGRAEAGSGRKLQAYPTQVDC
jgi:hypothetical protein